MESKEIPQLCLTKTEFFIKLRDRVISESLPAGKKVNLLELAEN